MKNSGIEWIGEIPDSWELQPLRGHLIEIKESNDPIQTTQVLSLTNKLGVIPYEEKGEQGNKSKENYNEYKLAYPNTIVANSMNILIGSVGICNYFGCVSPVYYVFKPKDEQELKFLDYIFQSQPFQKELRKYAKGILEIRLRVSANDILRRQVAFPSSQQQREIVDFLEAKLNQVDELIANQQGQIEKLKEYKQSVITEAVTKGLDKSAPLKDSGIEWIGEIPAHWGITRIKNLFELRNERNDEADLSKVNLISLYTDLGVVQHSDIVETTGNRAVTAEGYKFVYKNDIVVNIILCWMGAVGMSNYDGVTSPAYDIYKPKNGTLSEYYHYLFRTKRFNGECYRYGRGIMLMRWRTYSAEFTAINIPEPPKQEQIEILSYLKEKSEKIDRLIAIKQEKIEKLQEYKKSLIYEYVTGKKEVV